MSIPSRLRHFYAAQQAATPAEYERLMDLHRRGIAMENTPPERSGRIDALGARLDALLERLDARRKADPGQMDLFGGGGGSPGKPCGEGHIAAPLKCHKGGGGTPAAEEKAPSGPMKLTDQQIRDAMVWENSWKAEENGWIDSRATQRAFQKLRGFDAKPEVVPDLDALHARGDLLLNKYDKPLVLHRGVINPNDKTSYIETFKYGKENHIGGGVHGSGTYAAEQYALAELYTREDFGPNVAPISNRNMVAFGIRADANVVRVANEKEEDAFEREICDRASATVSKAVGREVSIIDSGLAATIEGIDAYNAEPKAGRRAQWVVLNRSKVVASDEYSPQYQWT